jgi:hypothetical protein
LGLKAIRGVGEQFGHCVQIPVCRGGIDMTEPGRQQWKAHLNVPPSQYQSIIVVTAKVCRRSWSLAGLRPGSVVRPAAATICLKVTPRLSGLSGPRRLLTKTVGQARAAVPTHS